MNTRLLITGGAGFIGINLVRYLLSQDTYKISIIDDLSSGSFEVLKSVASSFKKKIEFSYSKSLDSICFIKGDVRDQSEIDSIVQYQDQVIHLAAQTGVQPSIEDPGGDFSVNLSGTFKLLESLRKYQVKVFILASSAAALGDQSLPITENKIPRPLSPYGASKLAAEAYCSAYAHSYGLGCVILRFSNVYGPFSFLKGSAVAHFLKLVITNHPITIYGDGSQTRDFLYVDDISRVINLILTTKRTDLGGEVFQLGTGVETSINQLVMLLEKIINKKLKVKFAPTRAGEIKNNYTSIKKVQDLLGFEPQFDLETGLKETWTWFKHNQDKLT